MSGVNKVILVGHLGDDPTYKELGRDNAVANANLATSESYKDKDGKKVENTQWHRLVMYGKLADIADKYLRKGSLIYAEGKLQTRKYQDKDGVERSITEVVVNNMQMLGPKQDGGGGRGRDDDDRGRGRSRDDDDRGRGRDDDRRGRDDRRSSRGGDDDDLADIPF